MKKVILLSLALFICGATMSQSNVKRDAQGNYVAISKPKKVVKDSVLAVSYIDKAGVRHPVHVGSRGGKYILRTSKKSGKVYKYYLKEEK